ncbi:hypothetical protein DSUL_50466 [Desulfovibrionales bacterium]
MLKILSKKASQTEIEQLLPATTNLFPNAKTIISEIKETLIEPTSDYVIAI